MAARERIGFEGLIAWQKARQLATEVRHITADPRFVADRDLVWQLRGAAVSVMANIAEGWDRGSSVETARFLGIAKASCAEVRSHLYVALDSELIDETAFEALRASALEVSRIIAGLRRALRAGTRTSAR